MSYLEMEGFLESQSQRPVRRGWWSRLVPRVLLRAFSRR